MNASPLLILTPLAGDRWRWQLLDDACETQQGEATVDTLAAIPRWAAAPCLLAVPGEQVVLASAAVGPGERRLLRKSVPYSLEEDLLSDLETLHLALGPVADGRVAVAVMAAAPLAQWLRMVEQAGGEVVAAVPEPLLLPWQADSWTLRADAARWVLRFDRVSGFAMEPMAARLALSLAVRERGCPPRLFVTGDGAAALAATGDPLPEGLAAVAAPLTAQSGVLSRRQTGGASTGSGAVDVPIDLRQGAFARRLPWRRRAREWRVPALAIAAALVVQFGATAWHLHRLQGEQVELRRAIETTYRTVAPQGVLTDAEIQLRRRMTAIAGDAAQQFMPLMATVGAVLATASDVELTALDYSNPQRELRLSLVAASFSSVEQLRGAIAAAGLAAELVHSSADGARTRAQLRVRSPGTAPASEPLRAERS